jgi:hypothetical protein
LLEVMLAIAISLLLVAALYVALDVQMRYMQSGRNAVAEGQVARGLLARMARDIRLSLAALPKMQNQGQGGAAAGTTNTGTTPATGTGATDGGDPAAADPAAADVGTTVPGQFNLGIVGDENQLNLFVSTVPRYGWEEAEIQTGLSDLRRISYTLVPGQGLVRQEVRNVTADSMQQDSEAIIDILATEVVDLRFEYYDASTGEWLPVWDGTTTGPPLAVRITLAIQPPAETSALGLSTKPPTLYSRVVEIPGAAIPQELVNQQAGVTPTTQP